MSIIAWINIVLLALGVTSSFYTLKGNRNWFWYFVACVPLFMIVNINMGLYLEAMRYLIFLGINSYTYWYWGKARKEGQTYTKTKKLSKNATGIFVGVYVGTFALITFINWEIQNASFFTDWTGEITPAFYIILMDTLLAVTAYFAIGITTHKYIESQYLWQLYNFISVAFLINNVVLEGNWENAPYLVLRTFYTVMTFFTINAWKKQFDTDHKGEAMLEEVKESTQVPNKKGQIKELEKLGDANKTKFINVNSLVTIVRFGLIKQPKTIDLFNATNTFQQFVFYQRLQKLSIKL